MSDPLRTTYDAQPTPRRWVLRICDCGVRSVDPHMCAGFPGIWDEELGDFQRGGCLAELVDVVEVLPEKPA